MNYGIVFIVLSITFIVCLLCWVINDTLHKKIKAAIVGGISIPTVCGFIICMCAITSYNTYLNIARYPVTEYRQSYAAITEYDKIISNKGENTLELTDMKFSGYQKEMARLIREHKYKLVKHNNTIMEKRIVANNILVGFLIFEPDPSMKILPFTPE